ncbi:hypothetical protein LPJ72_004918 [Coemansia sp. Benny D160-2]|nr:hypothetical protein LPJ72_004918 [Coemansia sp. Benny D160-2]
MDGSQRATVARLLEEATSQDAGRIAAAEEELRACETKHNHYATLFEIFADRPAATTTAGQQQQQQTRWLAIINFKNGIDKYWKRADLHRIGLGEKQTVRAHLMDYFDEQTPAIAVQYCVAVARIARWDFPRVWPEFADDLLARIRAIAGQQQQLQQQQQQEEEEQQQQQQQQTMELNALYTMHLFVKTLCQRSMPAERQALRRITPPAFATVGAVYAERLGQLQQLLVSGDNQQNQHQHQVRLLKSIRMCLKILRRLLVFGYAKIEDADHDAQQFYVASSTHQAVFYDLYWRLSSAQRASADAVPLRKIVLLYGKMYLDFQNSHAIRFITTPGVGPMLAWYWARISEEAPRLAPPLDAAIADDEGGEGAGGVILEPLLIQGLTLYKNVVRNFFYATDGDGDDGAADPEVSRCREIIDTQLVPPPLVAQMAALLMRCYLPLKPRDLVLWRDDAETWLADEAADYWNFDVRRCAEHLFVDLASQHRDQLVALVAAAVGQEEEEEEEDKAADPSAAFYRRDGRLAALGLCANELYDAFDFCAWLARHRTPDSPLGAAKWRVAWLVGRWVPVRFEAAQRPHAYALLLELAGPDSPLVVRVEALASLLVCVDDWDFDAAQFSAHFLAPSLERIASVLAHVESADTRMRMVGFLSTLVQRMQRAVAPFADAIVQMVPRLWESAAGENMCQTAVLVLVTRLVEALGAQATRMQAFAAPLVAHSVDLATPAHVYLIEDGIELWRALLRNATDLDDSLLALALRIPPLLHTSTDLLRNTLRLVESYFLLAGERTFACCGPAILDALHSLVADTTLAARATLVGYNALSVVVQCTPPALCAEPLTQSNVLWTGFTRIVDHSDSALVLVHHSAFLSRVAVQYPALFGEFLAAQDAAVASVFCSHWVGLHADITQVPARRLHAFALAVAVGSTANDGVLAMLPRAVPLWNEIISDTGSSALLYGSGSEYDGDDAYPLAADDDDYVVAENARRKSLLAADPVYAMDFRSVLAQSMAQCERLNGAARFHAILSRVDPEQLAMLQNQLS